MTARSARDRNRVGNADNVLRDPRVIREYVGRSTMLEVRDATSGYAGLDCCKK